MATIDMGLVRKEVTVAELFQRAGYEVIVAFEAIVDSVKSHAERRSTARELASLSDRQLRDINVSRSDIDAMLGA